MSILEQIASFDQAMDDITGGLEEALNERPLNVEKVRKLAALRVRLGEAQRIAKTSLIGKTPQKSGILTIIIR